MKKLILFVKGLYHFVRVAQDPKRTDNAIALVDTLQACGLYRLCLETLKTDPVTAKVIETPLALPRFDLDSLLQDYAPGTLGHEFARRMKEQNLDPNYFRRHGLTSEVEIIASHLDQTHDLWHVITGFDTSVAGEVGLQAFLFGQMRAPHAVAFIAGGIVRGLFAGLHEVGPVLDDVCRGWQLAKAWPPLFAMPWAEVMSWPLTEIRGELSQGRLPSGPSLQLKA
jgi:ubiquinone biosynthesis protein Coq4